MPTGSVPVVVTEGNGWHEQPGDRAELDVGYAATGPDRATAVAELGRRVAAAARRCSTRRSRYGTAGSG